MFHPTDMNFTSMSSFEHPKQLVNKKITTIVQSKSISGPMQLPLTLSTLMDSSFWFDAINLR